MNHFTNITPMIPSLTPPPVAIPHPSKLPTYHDLLEWLNTNRAKRWSHITDALYSVYEKKLPGLFFVSAYLDMCAVRDTLYGTSRTVQIKLPPLPIGCELKWKTFKPYRHNVSFSATELLDFLIQSSPTDPPIHYIIAWPNFPPRLTFTPLNEEIQFIVHATPYPDSAKRWLGRSQQYGVFSEEDTNKFDLESTARYIQQLKFAGRIVTMNDPLYCSVDFTPAKGTRFELVRIQGGHVFAWQVAPAVRAQYLLCVVCGKPHHVLFPSEKFAGKEGV